ncbi:cytochrome c-type biogenesis protein [Chitinibacteraceae bacterium HSL-7]
MKRLLLLLLLALSAHAATPTDAEVEARLHQLSGELRCLVCQNESLASSRAPLAEDLRREVRERIRLGESNQEVVDFLVSRYGDFVTYRPPMAGRTLLLWLGPLALVLLLIALLIRKIRQPRAPEARASADDIEALRREFGDRS